MLPSLVTAGYSYLNHSRSEVAPLRLEDTTTNLRVEGSVMGINIHYDSRLLCRFCLWTLLSYSRRMCGSRSSRCWWGCVGAWEYGGMRGKKRPLQSLIRASVHQAMSMSWRRQTDQTDVRGLIHDPVGRWRDASSAPASESPYSCALRPGGQR